MTSGVRMRIGGGLQIPRPTRSNPFRQGGEASRNNDLQLRVVSVYRGFSGDLGLITRSNVLATRSETRTASCRR